MRYASTPLAATACLFAALTLTGCGGAGIDLNIGDIADNSVQDAIDTAGDALDQANRALVGAASDLDESMGQLADALRELSDVPGLLSALFSDNELADTSSRLELIDAQTGEVLDSLDTASELEQVGDSLSGMDVNSWQLVSHVPDDIEADRILRFYSKKTATMLESGDNQEIETLKITTYKNAPYATMNISVLDLTLDFQLPQQDADTLRNLL